MASPSAIANTPVASGSSVPAWPAFLASSAQRTLLTTAVDVMPAGLSTITQPEMSRPLRLRPMCHLICISDWPASGPRSVRQLLDDTNDRAKPETNVRSTKIRGVQAGHLAVEIQRIRRA